MLVLCCVIFFLSLQRIVFVFVFAGYTFSAPQFSHLQTYIYNTQSVSLSLSIGLCPLHARRARFRNFGFFFKKMNSIQQSVLNDYLPIVYCIPKLFILILWFRVLRFFFLSRKFKFTFFFDWNVTVGK